MSDQDVKVTPQESEDEQPEDVRASSDARRPVGIIGDRVTAPPSGGGSGIAMLIAVFLFGCVLSAFAMYLVLGERAQESAKDAELLDAQLHTACSELAKIAGDQVNDAIAAITDRNFGMAERQAERARNSVAAAATAKGSDENAGLQGAKEMLDSALDKLAVNDLAAADDLANARQRIGSQTMGPKAAGPAEGGQAQPSAEEKTAPTAAESAEPSASTSGQE